MLQAIREKAQGWIAWAIVILISIPFALWGIQEYLGVGGEPEVAVVNGEPITERMLDQRTREFRENLRASLGDSYSASLFDDAELKPQVLDAMIEEKVLVDTTRDWNLRASDPQVRGFIASLPAFQRDGAFDQLAYESAVRNRGMTRAGFEQSIRQEMTVRQLRAGLANSAFVTETALAARTRLQEQKRDIAYAVIPASAYTDAVNVTDQALADFFAANSERYRVPERVRLNYLVLDAPGLGQYVDVEESALRQYFEDHRSEFMAHEERAMRHILFAVPGGAEGEQVEAAKAKAEKVMERIRAGEDFASLASEFSDDPGSAANGGDLGWVERGMMVAPFEQAGFALSKGEVSELVRTDFGFHIIQVTDIRGGSDATFDDLREQVDAAYRKFEGENLYFEYAERLAESAYENSDSLVPASEALDLTIKTSDWLSRDSSPAGLLAHPKVLNIAFSDDVLGERHNSELIEVGPQQAVVIRVADYEPAGTPPLEQIKDRVRADFVKDSASRTAAETGSKALQELASGTSLEALAGRHAWRFEHPGFVQRDGSEAPFAVVAKAFGMPPSTNGLRHAGVSSENGDYLLLELRAVEGGSLDHLSVAERPLVAEQVGSQLGAAQFDYVSESLLREASVEKKMLRGEQ
ncbi:MAG: SurA N-terminal domain-containing protein [Gammaproteobacteria bacterium]|nr:SurA N-terminal domain-containing protein [Gammaproteobacteria bacterium]